MSTRNEDSGALEPWDPNEFEAVLLGSVAQDAPTCESMHKTLSALAAASATGAAVHAAGVGGVRSLLTLKAMWMGASLALACGAVGIGLFAGGDLVAPTPSAPPPASTAAATPSPTGASNAVAPAIVTVAVETLPSVEAATAPPASAPSRRPAPSTTAAEPSTTEREIALLQGVRDALGVGRPAEAVATLRALERDRAIRLFEPEARVLMIEALAAEGSSVEARDRADAFLRDFPHDMHVARVRRVRGQMSNP